MLHVYFSIDKDIFITFNWWEPALLSRKANWLSNSVWLQINLVLPHQQ